MNSKEIYDLMQTEEYKNHPDSYGKFCISFMLPFYFMKDLAGGFDCQDKNISQTWGQWARDWLVVLSGLLFIIWIVWS